MISSSSSTTTTYHSSTTTSYLNCSEMKELKLQFHRCLSTILEEVDARFPGHSLEIFRYMQIFDPFLRNLYHGTRANVMKLKNGIEMLYDTFRTTLPHDFELDDVQSQAVNFMTSPIVDRIFIKTYKKDPKGHWIQTNIYSFYEELMSFAEFSIFAKFVLILLMLPTGNAISERGFSLMKNIISTKRNSISMEQAQIQHFIAFNGSSDLKDFKSHCVKSSAKPNWFGRATIQGSR